MPHGSKETSGYGVYDLLKDEEENEEENLEYGVYLLKLFLMK